MSPSLFPLQGGLRSPILNVMNTSLGFIGGLGGQEMIIIFLIVLLLFGAKKLPELARGVGKSMGEFKKARDDFEREITRSEEEVKKRDEAKARAEDEIRIREAAGKESVEKA
jgi:sec-independent protein translocase protein TatA